MMKDNILEISDLQKFYAFKAVLGQGKFELEGKAMLGVASLFQWFYGLENIFKEKPLVPTQEQKSAVKHMKAIK